ncbi:hypothetical protein NOVOSPHI9U_560001 [Novosphingobium sp. 9U]|nr:hypothetical protein NOVOSPHI9U_560001 [Novosphingobium sp. 9U]
MEGSPAKLHHAAAYADREDDHAPGNGISKALLQPTRLDDKRQKLASEEGGLSGRNWAVRSNYFGQLESRHIACQTWRMTIRQVRSEGVPQIFIQDAECLAIVDKAERTRSRIG